MRRCGLGGDVTRIRIGLPILCAGALLLGSCTQTKDPAVLLVTIDGDSMVRSRATVLQVVIRGEKGGDVNELPPLVYGEGEAPVGWPRRVSIVPQGGDTDRTVSVRVGAFESAAADPFIEARVVTGFEREQTMALRIMLDARCVDVRCDDEETCFEGECVDPRDAWQPVPYVPEDGGPSADAEPDTGATDGGPSADAGCDDGTAQEVWYRDCDGDGYAAADAESTISCGKPDTSAQCTDWTRREPGSMDAMDCDDTMPLVNPGVTEDDWFATPYCVGAGVLASGSHPNWSCPAEAAPSFDYDCNGIEDRSIPSTVTSAECERYCAACPCEDCSDCEVCHGGACRDEGWSGAALPQCGETATWQDCHCDLTTSCVSCVDGTRDRLLQCR
jgi:hypothetical protein